MYAIWIKIDSTLPWIELKECYRTRNEAKKGAQDFLKSMQMRVVRIPDNAKLVRTLITVKSKH